MKRLTDKQMARFENNLMALAAPLYAVLGAVGAVFKISALEFLVTDPRALVPAIASFLFLLSRNILRVADELHEIRSGENQLLFQSDITSTHGSMWLRAQSHKTQRIWTSYLNPDAFSDGSVADSLKEYYKKAERVEVSDYRRVFAIYPDKPPYQGARRKGIDWIVAHLGRTKRLKSYQARYVELEFQAAEMWIDDGGINFSFPSSRIIEGGWSTSDPRAIELAKDYYQQLWHRARPAEELMPPVTPALLNASETP